MKKRDAVKGRKQEQTPVTMNVAMQQLMLPLAAALPVQHRRAGTGSGRPARRAPRLERGLRARLHGKGGKWRTCPLWDETARLLRQLMGESPAAQAPVFCSAVGKPLTRFGIYRLVRRHTARLQDEGSAARRIGPHVFRHTTAVHLLEAGVEVNVIRGWLGHVNLSTTNRYADINIRTKEAALRQCAPPPGVGGPKARAPVWRNDETMLAWLASL